MKLTAIAIALILAGCAAAPKELPLTAAEARAEEAKHFAMAMASAKDAETQRLLIFAQFSGKGNQPTIIQDNGNRTVADVVFNFLDRTTERLFSVAPAYFAYKGQVRAAETTKSVAEINRDVSVNQSNNFLALGVAGINGSAQIGTALANRPTLLPQPATQVTVTGNSGPVQIGSGTQNNSSLNPVNDRPFVCNTTSAGVTTCSR